MNTNSGLTCVHLTDQKPYPTVHEVENAYLDDQLSREVFSQVLQILKAQSLSSKNNLSPNYAIQQLFEHPNAYYDPKAVNSYRTAIQVRF